MEKKTDRKPSCAINNSCPTAIVITIKMLFVQQSAKQHQCKLPISSSKPLLYCTHINYLLMKV